MATLEQVCEAILSVDGADPSLWTKGGLPKMEVLERILGEDISAELRNEAMSMIDADEESESDVSEEEPGRTVWYRLLTSESPEIVAFVPESAIPTELMWGEHEDKDYYIMPSFDAAPQSEPKEDNQLLLVKGGWINRSHQHLADWIGGGLAE